MNLLGWHWLIKLYRFQVCNSLILHLYIVLCVHHPNSSLLPSPFIPHLPSSTSPTPFPSDNHHTVVCVYEVVFFFCLIHSHFSPSPVTILPSDSCPSLWVCFCLFYLFVLFLRFHISAKSYGVFLSLTGLFHLTEYSPGLSMLLQKGKISFLFTAQ